MSKWEDQLGPSVTGGTVWPCKISSDGLDLPHSGAAVLLLYATFGWAYQARGPGIKTAETAKNVEKELCGEATKPLAQKKQRELNCGEPYSLRAELLSVSV